MRSQISNLLLVCILPLVTFAGSPSLEQRFLSPPPEARPWVFWYWVNAAVSREGITADLESMRDAGLGGAYLCFVRGPTNPPLTDKPAIQLSPEWWGLVDFAIHEADRLNLKLGLHASDGFATAGGPWISPELSMQKLTWSATEVEGGSASEVVLPEPPHLADYYRDIAVLAFPASPARGEQGTRQQPKISSSLINAELDFLAGGGRTGTFRAEEKCWIQYSYENPFTARSVRLWPAVNNFPALRPRLEVSDDGLHFRKVTQLEPARHGWRDYDQPHTYAIEPVTARHFRFIFDKEGAEPGSENLETAKWRPVIKIRRMELSESARLNAYEGKTAQVWRVAHETTEQEAGSETCIPLKNIVVLKSPDGADGKLRCELPAGRWTLLRLGHTTTGTRNDTAGGGQGLECDKFNPAAVRLQFDRWFGEITRRCGPELAARTIKIFHVDSWECGSQNWSPVVLEEFKRRRGYDPLPFLPAMAGYPVMSAAESERFLRDMRRTFSELVNDNFFGTLAGLVRERGIIFSAECVAPIMAADGIQPFSQVDIPMGEFWLRSPTHDKPNDMLDAISGAHIYGKRIVQAEAFTQLRIAWDETPALIKPLADRALALGINRLVHHVTVHNPWPDRRPGLTLGGVGLFFQRDQSWWPLVSAWNEYLTRCQALLQEGRPVVDIAVFTGEEIPSRALLPSELLSSLPGLIGEMGLERERRRLANVGQPLRDLPSGVVHSANTPDLSTWTDPLRGYAYDSITRDALLRLAKVERGRIVLPGGASYGLLIVPGKRPLSPNAIPFSPELKAKLDSLISEGARVVFANNPETAITTPTLDSYGIPRDFEALDASGARLDDIVWTHRRGEDWDLYFVSNQSSLAREICTSLRATGKDAEVWDPVSGERRSVTVLKGESQRRKVPLALAANGSAFIVLRSKDSGADTLDRSRRVDALAYRLEADWTLSLAGAPEQKLDRLGDWTKLPGGEAFSGMGSYRTEFSWTQSAKERIWLDLGQVRDIARVRLNGIDCGIAWTAPYRVEITKTLREGKNELHIEVANTWHNRLLADKGKGASEVGTWVSSPVRTAALQPLPAGLLGPVTLLTQ